LKSISPLMHSFRRGDFLGDRSSEKSTCDRPIQQRKTGRSPLQMLHDWQGDRFIPPS
jgi:hypothetical protein